MSIAYGQQITWTDFTSTVLSSLKSVCCNIDNVNSVPTRLRSGQGQLAVKSLTSSVSGGASQVTHTWYANPSQGLISAVTTATVESEWSTFLSSAGISARSTKIIQAKELGLAMGLYQQFMSYHLKPVYSRRQIYNTVESQSLFQGTKYITGTCTPKYTLTAVEPGSVPAVTDSDITNLVNQDIYWPSNNWGLLDRTNNPNVHRVYLS